MNMNMNPTHPVVSFRNVRKSYGSTQILKGISLDVTKGQVVTLIGQSGSGKSTALRCINGLERINGGELTVAGHALHDSRLNLQQLRNEVGIVFQSYNLFPHLNVEQNITLAPRKVKKLSQSQAKEIAYDVLGKAGLLEKKDAYPDQLSGGQQQRVAIARSLAMSPTLMLFDEVTSALDPQITGEVLRVIEKLACDGMTMVLVTHEMGFARAVSDQIFYLKDGVVGFDIDAATLLAKDLKVKLKVIPVTGPTRVQYLLTNKVDAIMASFSITAERQKVIDFSDPYAVVPVVLGGPKTKTINSLKDLAGQNIAVTRGTTSDQAITKGVKDVPNVTITRYEDDATTNTAVLTGQQDYIVAASSVLPEIKKTNPDRDVEYKLTVVSFPMGIGIRKNDPQLKARLNEWVAKYLKNGQLNSYYQKYFFGQSLPAEMIKQ